MSVAQIKKKRSREAPKRPPFYKDEAFWRGVASVFNMTGYFTPKYYGRDPEQADYEALCSDWEAVGQDMERSIRSFERAYSEELRRAGQPRLFDPGES